MHRSTVETHLNLWESLPVHELKSLVSLMRVLTSLLSHYVYDCFYFPSIPTKLQPRASFHLAYNFLLLLFDDHDSLEKMYWMANETLQRIWEFFSSLNNFFSYFHQLFLLLLFLHKWKIKKITTEKYWNSVH